MAAMEEKTGESLHACPPACPAHGPTRPGRAGGLLAGGRRTLLSARLALLDAVLGLRRLSSWLTLPGACALCGQDCPVHRPALSASLARPAAPSLPSLCGACRAACLDDAPARCPRCAIPMAAPAPRCLACETDPPWYDAALTAASYGAPLDQLAVGLKFGARLAHAPLLASLLREALLRQRGDALPALLPDLLLAVPLGEARLAARGFNQALEIARALAHDLGVPLLHDVPRRVRETPPQSRLPFGERQDNLRDAFALPAGAAAQIAGRHVGLVDDVMTTGATLNELAHLLKRHGAARVTCLAALRTPHAPARGKKQG